MSEEINQLKVRLAENVQRFAKVRETQSHQSVLWFTEHKATPLAERLKLEHELMVLKSERMSIETQIALVNLRRSTEPRSYYSDLCGHLIRVCVEAGRDDLVALAKEQRKQEEKK